MDKQANSPSEINKQDTRTSSGRWVLIFCSASSAVNTAQNMHNFLSSHSL